MKYFPILLLASIFALNIVVYSQTDFTEIQTFIDSNITRNFLNTNFDNSLLSANYISRLNYYNRFKKINFYFKNYYSSSVTKLAQNLYRDFDNVKAGSGYNVSDNLNISVNYLGQFFSDDKSFQLKGTSSNMGYLNALYDRTIGGSQIYSFVNAGYKAEEQIGEFNNGPSILGEFNIYGLNISDFIVDGQLKLGYESLDPRKKSLAYTRLYFERSFENNLARNEFDGVFSRIRKDFYFPADNNSKVQFGINNNIEKRVENIFKFFDRFDYSVSKNIDFYLTLNPYYRKVTKENFYIPVVPTLAPSIYDTDIQELTVAGDVALNLSFDKINYQIKAAYKERDEKHFLLNPGRVASNFVNRIQDQEATKNNHSSIFQLNSNLYYNLNLMNRLELFANASILTYDTPSRENYDDRDELGIIIYLAHRFNNLKNLILTTSADLNLYHTVYIFAQKSSNNNWNRILRFTSRSYFTPADWFRNVGTFSVLANYTVYDFEDIVSSVQSYSFRQLNLKDSAIVNFSKHFGVDIFGEIKLYERGELNWREFSQRPINYFEDKIINSELNYFFNKFITISAGYRFFEQRRYNYIAGERVFDTFIRTTGPFARLRVEWKRNSRIEVLGSYDYYRYGDETPSSQNENVYINAVFNF
ncbi:MAG: hypothetical protein L0Y79_03105 [Chlorobi bacterium]|nr:hypothetical protein [Chlorobiota bacterium]MCI0716027.1 hypothetical protein [Chlorobiota bacterium]